MENKKIEIFDYNDEVSTILEFNENDNLCGVIGETFRFKPTKYKNDFDIIRETLHDLMINNNISGYKISLNKGEI